MAFSTNLQQTLNYLKQGHAVLPTARPATPFPQFNTPRVAPAMTPPVGGAQTVQGIMPQTAPPGVAPLKLR